MGNTPSQTEVKIISCIPIDVTDLQNKIVDLERELDERERARDATPSSEDDEPRRHSTVGAAIGAPAFSPAPAHAPTPAITTTEPIACNHILETPNSLNAVSPSPSLHAEPPSRISLSGIDSGPARMPKSSTGATVDDSEALDLGSTCGYNCTTKKRKLPKLKFMDKKKKGQTQMVYFAQTVYPKKAGAEMTHRGKRRRANEEDLSRTYLADVVQRQYWPELINVEPSTSSGFSWPVCRDEPAGGGGGARLRGDSDVCSCCHGLFHNVDVPDDTDHAAPSRRDHSVYYDSSLYDVVPVKETPSRIMMESNVYQKRQNDVYLDMEGDYFSNKLNKTRVQFQQPYITKYCAVAAPFKPSPKLRYKKKLPNKSALKKEQVMRAMQRRKQDRNLDTDVDCGEVYSKPLNPKPRVIMSTTPSLTPTPSCQPSPPCPPCPVLKNAECLTTFDARENHTLVSRSVQLEPPPAPAPPPSAPAPQPPPPPTPHDNKTEITLNQIKSILHAVLTEVKTNALKQTVLEDKSRKDAVVQNGPSQSNIATNSSYMNSYLFGPRYSFCPYGPSLSGQTAVSQGFYPPGSVVPTPCLYRPESKTTPRVPLNAPGPSPCAGAAKCVQNYPLFVHTTGRQCACCYRSVPAQPNLTPACPQPANISPSVNANKNEQRNKETNNLIKEIYKSLALNMDYPQKDTSSNYTAGRSSVNASNKKFEFKIEPKKKPKAVSSEILHKDTKPALFISKALGEQYGSTAMSYRSEVQTGTTASAAATDSATPQGDGVRSLLSAKKELVSTGSDTAHETRERSPNAARDRKYSPSSARERKYSPPTGRNREYSPPAGRDSEYLPDKHERQYSPSDKRGRGYLPSDSRHRMYPPSEKQDRRYAPSEKHERKYSPANKRDCRYSPAEDQGRDTPPTVTASISDEDTATPSIDDSEDSETTVIDTESLQKKEKKGIFSKMKKLFTTRPRRRRKKDEESTSETGQEPTTDSDDYETIYSEQSSRSGKNAKHHRPLTPPPAPRRRKAHSKLSFSPRHYRRGSPAPHSPRYRHESPVAAPAPRHRRSPYMEQEYRRHWTEELTFHQRNRPPYSSERPYTRSGREYEYGRQVSPPARWPAGPGPGPRPYWREYEARPVLVPPPPRAPLPPLRHPCAPRPPGPPHASQQPYARPQQYQPTGAGD